MNPTFRLVAFGISAGICSLIAYLAMTHQIGGIADFFQDKDAIKVVQEEKKPPPPPPPPPPPRERPPPPPPMTRIEPPPLNVPAPPDPDPTPPAKTSPPAVTPPTPDPPRRPTITSAAFDRLPDGRAFERFYPSRAREREESGRVVLRCSVNASGALVGCEVVSETPPNWGFGEASLRIAREFRVRPQTADGVATDGGTITFPIRWQMGR